MRSALAATIHLRNLVCGSAESTGIKVSDKGRMTTSLPGWLQRFSVMGWTPPDGICVPRWRC